MNGGEKISDRIKLAAETAAAAPTNPQPNCNANTTPKIAQSPDPKFTNAGTLLRYIAFQTPDKGIKDMLKKSGMINHCIGSAATTNLGPSQTS